MPKCAPVCTHVSVQDMVHSGMVFTLPALAAPPPPHELHEDCALGPSPRVMAAPGEAGGSEQPLSLLTSLSGTERKGQALLLVFLGIF